MYLLDTNVVSEFRRARPSQAVIAWIKAVPAVQLFVSAVTIGEIQAGIEITRDQDPKKAGEIERWLEGIASTYGVLDADDAVFREWARLKHRKSSTVMEDALIAATAKVAGLTVVTRNTKHFEMLGIKSVNPFGK